MLIIRIWNYFRGYVIIKIEGLTLEKFINLAIAKNIFLWDIVRVDYTSLEAKVSIAGFKELKEVIQRVGCRVFILNKKGYPFLLRKFKYRKMLALGSIISITLIFFLTSFIWSIDIIGNEGIKNEQINNVLASINVKEGMRKREAKKNDIKDTLLLKIRDLSYVNIEITGTRMIVEVRERDVAPDKIDKSIPCDIISSKKAVIEKIIVMNGKGVVSKGDIVKEGQVLISGTISNERMELPLEVHSEGKIIGKTWYKEIVEEPIIKSINEETGKTFTTREIKIGDKRIQLINGEIPFKNYIEENKVKKVGDLGIVKLPVEIIQYIYKEVEIIEIKQDIDSLKKITSVKATQALMNKLPNEANVISKDVKYLVEDNILTTEVIVEVNEELGVKKKITINNNQEN